MRILLSLLCLLAVTAQAGTLSDVRERGTLRCGVNSSLPGFASQAKNGEWTGLDTDYCRAVASAVLRDPNAVTFVPLSATERFVALRDGKVDLLARNTTWTATRDTALGLRAVGVLYYDGQGFLVRKSLGVRSVRQLGGKSICMHSGTTTELNVADFFESRRIPYTAKTFEASEQTFEAFRKGECDVFSSDQAQLYALRSQLPDATQYQVLPEIISKEPLSPFVRNDDSQWINITRWTLHALIAAEELGIRSGNIDEQADSRSPAVQRFLGRDGRLGSFLGLDAEWTGRVIKQVGNYAEIFDRHLGTPPLDIRRGLNALWTQGGLMYSPPFR